MNTQKINQLSNEKLFNILEKSYDTENLHLYDFIAEVLNKRSYFHIIENIIEYEDKEIIKHVINLDDIKQEFEFFVDSEKAIEIINQVFCKHQEYTNFLNSIQFYNMDNIKDKFNNIIFEFKNKEVSNLKKINSEFIIEYQSNQHKNYNIIDNFYRLSLFQDNEICLNNSNDIEKTVLRLSKIENIKNKKLNNKKFTFKDLTGVFMDFLENYYSCFKYQSDTYDIIFYIYRDEIFIKYLNNWHPFINKDEYDFRKRLSFQRG